MEPVAFDALPLRKDGPHEKAWGVFFGRTDQLGILNRLTPETTREAAKEIIDGVRVSTDWFLDSMQKPCFGRPKLEHVVNNKAPRAWDGFRHHGYQNEKIYINDCTLEEIQSGDRNGIHVWVENGGIVGRGVLLDYASWAEEHGIQINCFSTSSISVSSLKEIAISQGTTFKTGDILFIRTGWTHAYEHLSAEQCQELADVKVPPAIGVESSEETLRWIWEEGFAAVAGDMPSFEAWPCQNIDFWLHEWVLAGWGFPIGELFDLDRLSQECRKRNRWSFFFSSCSVEGNLIVLFVGSSTLTGLGPLVELLVHQMVLRFSDRLVRWGD
ncbi:hypothetical protein BDQ94DRAFT_161727 [Aspergillus welwitschiae]|uniref:Cyclase-domain-containing protein n=1 Tax=Aspergillus welwitschiae TaxID=1341132 RepID=A0A3F3PST8_9EURO|nr:hypothetical protein BDQ94DRAFT_161727 [Aspergillus welwitschiae]RDH29969.1 hypothetical protein BDQ94DRAFT_161727 [Aspergillus welwitschiae]